MYANFLKRFKAFLNAILCVQIVAMVTLCFLQTVMRYVFNSPLTWSEEITRFLFIWMAFIGSALASASKEHINVNVLPAIISRDSPIGGELVMITISSLNSFFLVYLIATGSQLVNYTVQVAPATFFPWKLVYLAIPVGSLFMLYFEIGFIVFSIKKIIALIRNTAKI